MNNGTDSLPYEMLLLLVLYRLSRPRHIKKELEGIFGLHKSKIPIGISFMMHAIQALIVEYLDNLVTFTKGYNMKPRGSIKMWIG